MRAMSVGKFMARFPDEQACRDYIFQIRWPRGFICTKCGENDYRYIRTRHLYECSACKTQVSTTANTVMHRTKLPLRYWLLVFYWMASGEKCSARKISKTLSLNYRTASLLLLKIRLGMYRGEFDVLSPFWLPNSLQTPSIVKKAKRRLRRKADLFIRKYYRRVTKRNKRPYYYEYRFRNNNQHNPAKAIDKLITIGVSTVYTVHEYRLIRSPAS
jgi:hypothetical protein